MHPRHNIERFARLFLFVGALAVGCGGEEPEADADADEGDATAARLPSTAGSKADAARDAASGETSDGGVPEPDAGAPDAAVSHDAASAQDAGSGAQSGAFCDSDGPHAACADFDTSTLADWSWLELSSELGSTLAITQEGVAPGPSVMRASTTGAPGETAMAAYRLPAELTDVTVSFDVKLELGAALASTNTWVNIQQVSGSAYGGVLLGTGAGGTVVAVQNVVAGQTTYQHFDLPALPRGWVHVRLHVVFGIAGSLEVQFDDAPPTRHENVRVLSDGVTQSSLRLGLYTQDGLPATAYYDDAALDYSAAR